MNGRFITFEGIEGSGKSSLVKRLQHELAAPPEVRILVTREPGEGIDREIRDFILRRTHLQPFSVALYMLMDRHEHVVGTIRPALADGAHVFCDRFTDSTLAYQGGGAGLDPAELRRLNALATGPTVPDRTFLLDLDVPASLERVRARAPHQPLDRFDSAGRDFHERVRAAYLEIARAEPGRVVVIDAARPPDAVLREVLAHLRAILAPAV